MTIDDIDLKVLHLLCEDGRMSHAALGKAVGLTGPSVYARIQRLEQDGIISGYTVLLDPEKLGHGLVAIVRVSTQTAAGEGERFEAFVQDEPEIVECYDVDGEDSYILKVRTASPGALRALLIRIRALPGITRTVTSIALATHKEARPGAFLAAPGRREGRQQ